MIIGLIGFTAIAGIGLYLWYCSKCQADSWRCHYRICRSERVNTRLALPRPRPRRWDYSRGIPSWNPALMLSRGFSPSSYRPRPGDSGFV